MARRGSNKARSLDQENHVAKVYGGRRNATSGAAPGEAGDVETPTEAFECKTTGEPGKPANSTLVKRLEKVADEAWEIGKDPALALRFFIPDSVLADPQGFVDVTVRLMWDDAERSRRLSEKTNPPIPRAYSLIGGVSENFHPEDY